MKKIEDSFHNLLHKKVHLCELIAGPHERSGNSRAAPAETRTRRGEPHPTFTRGGGQDDVRLHKANSLKLYIIYYIL